MVPNGRKKYKPVPKPWEARPPGSPCILYLCALLGKKPGYNLVNSWVGRQARHSFFCVGPARLGQHDVVPQYHPLRHAVGVPPPQKNAYNRANLLVVAKARILIETDLLPSPLRAPNRRSSLFLSEIKNIVDTHFNSHVFILLNSSPFCWTIHTKNVRKEKIKTKKKAVQSTKKSPRRRAPAQAVHRRRRRPPRPPTRRERRPQLAQKRVRVLLQFALFLFEVLPLFAEPQLLFH